MSDYFGDESPWGRPLADPDFNTFDASADVASPWAGGIGNAASDDDARSNKSDAVPNPYEDTPYSETNVPLVSDEAEGRDAQPLNGSDGANKPNSASGTEIADKPVPELKTVSRQPKANKKKRTGAVKVESVASDPLAAATAQLENVALTSDSVSNLGTDGRGSLSAADNPAYSDLNPNLAWTAQHKVTASSSSHGDTASLSTHATKYPNETFEINVGDASRVGDLTNSHTEYTVEMTTTSPSYDIKEAAVQRRYRDFRWLYRTLQHNHPGVVVPPPPEKQALGRFNDDFVQQRRAGLEQMLRKVTSHPLLRDDVDLKAFLTSPDFGDYLKSRLMSDEELDNSTRGALSQSEHGRSSSWGHDSLSGGSGSGFIGSLSGALSLSRGTELDPWTVEKRNHLDRVEAQLREVCKELVVIGTHRQQLSDALGDFANVVKVLSEIEATRRLSTVLRAFAKVHNRLAQVYARQRQQNLLTLESTLDEHLRTVGSIRDALADRQRIFSAAENAGSEVEKRQLALDKLLRQGKTQEDRQKALEEEIEELAQTASGLHQKAADIAHLVESEIARVNEEKIEEFRNSVEIYLENTVEAQKESIEIWETFYTHNFASGDHSN